jgi:hypothetical protein
MGKESFIQRIKSRIASIGWKLFLWGNSYTEEQYWEMIYKQERDYRENSQKYD